MNEEQRKAIVNGGAKVADSIREEVLQSLGIAIGFALSVIDENESRAIESIKKEAAGKRQSLEKRLQEYDNMSTSQIVRKFWSDEKTPGILTFCGDQVKVGNIG